MVVATGFRWQEKAYKAMGAGLERRKKIRRYIYELQILGMTLYEFVYSTPLKEGDIKNLENFTFKDLPGAPLFKEKILKETYITYELARGEDCAPQNKVYGLKSVFLNGVHSLNDIVIIISFFGTTAKKNSSGNAVYRIISSNKKQIIEVYKTTTGLRPGDSCTKLCPFKGFGAKALRLKSKTYT